METRIIPQHGNDMNKYLAIESKPATRRRYNKKLDIEPRHKQILYNINIQKYK